MLKNEYFVFTGTLTTMTRRQAQFIIEGLQGNFQNSVTKKTTRLVTGYVPIDLLIGYIREGDIVVVTELERLGRNSKDFTTIMNEIQQKGATLEVLNLPSMNGIEDENL